MENTDNQIKVALTSSLAELAKLEPGLWQEVMGSIRRTVELKQMSQLASMSQRAGATIHRWANASESPIAQTHHARQELIKARMTTLAIEQFIAAYTVSNVKPSYIDQMTLNWGILRSLSAGSLISLTDFEKSWNRISNKSAAATAIQSAGFWSILFLGVCCFAKDDFNGRVAFWEPTPTA